MSPTVTHVGGQNIIVPVNVVNGTLFTRLAYDGDGIPVVLTNGSVAVNLNPGDITIGAVEIQDHITAARCHVHPADEVNSASTEVLIVQHIDDAGTPLRESTQESIDLNTANTALVMLDLDETGTRQLGALTAIQTSTGNSATDLSAIRMTGTRTESLFQTGNAKVQICNATTGMAAEVTEDGHISALSVPISFEVSHSGTYSGKVANVLHIMGRRAGFNSTSILQDVAEFLAGTTDVLPVLAGTEPLEVVSSSTADDASPAGTGTHTVRIAYLDTNNDLVFVDVALNGTTPVSLGAVRMNFVLWMEALTGGTSEVSAGNIDLRVVAGAVVQERITANTNRSLSCRFVVPRNYSGYITGWSASTIGTSQDVRLRATVNAFDRAITPRYNFQDLLLLDSGQTGDGDLPWLEYPALTKIKVSCLPTATGAANRVESGFTVMIVRQS